MLIVRYNIIKGIERFKAYVSCLGPPPSGRWTSSRHSGRNVSAWSSLDASPAAFLAKLVVLL